MLFELENPWIEWIIITEIGEQTYYAKLDTGAYITLIGVDIAVKLGFTVDFIKKQKCVRYIGVVEESKGYAFKVPCASIPLGNTTIPISEIYVPFTFIDKTKYRFISEDRFLVGTDILNNYNLRVAFNDEPACKTADSAHLELLPHGLKLPKRHSPDYTLGQMAKTVGEVLVHIDEGLVEEVAESI